MIGRLIDMSVGLNGKQRITVEVNQDFRGAFDRLKEQVLDIEIKKHRSKRSLDANAYFHVLVNKLAIANGASDDEIKTALVLKYGTLDREKDGTYKVAALPSTADINEYHRYAKCYKTEEINGCLCNFYLFYKPTSEMDSAEMARLIDGTISDCKELGIETDTPEQTAKYKDD